MKNKIIILAGIAVLSSATSYAEETNSNAYIDASVGYANIENWWSASTALTINGGYNFNPYFAIEGGLTWIAPINSQTLQSTNYQQSQSFGDITAKGSVPLSDIFNIYAKAGLGITYSASSVAMSNTNSTYNWNGDEYGFGYGLYMGLGGELLLNHDFAITFEDYGVMPFTGNNWGNINVFSVGAKYNF